MSDGPSAPPQATSDHPVWRALSTHKIGGSDTFAPKLARETGWSAARAAAAIDEYRRFCFLAATGDRPLTPSDAVDRVWHLHLTYTRDYWERFCPDVLGRAFHHDPGGAGAAERHRHFDQYADTLARYEAAFGAAPPAALWPSAAELLDGPARRRDGLVPPRRSAFLIMFVVGTMLILGGVSWLLR